jgi:hypothetical protein
MVSPLLPAALSALTLPPSLSSYGSVGGGEGARRDAQQRAPVDGPVPGPGRPDAGARHGAGMLPEAQLPAGAAGDHCPPCDPSLTSSAFLSPSLPALPPTPSLSGTCLICHSVSLGLFFPLLFPPIHSSSFLPSPPIPPPCLPPPPPLLYKTRRYATPRPARRRST